VAREWSGLEKSAETIAYVVNVVRSIGLDRRITAAQAAGYQDQAAKVVLKTSPPNVFVRDQVSNPPKFPLKPPGMTDFDSPSAASYGKSLYRDCRR
jgi:hypothetical protein